MKQTGTKILIVDDEPAIRFALTEALRSWGYESFQASTVAEANELFASCSRVLPFLISICRTAPASVC